MTADAVTGRGQTMQERVQMVFLGQFEPESFAEFMRHRAERLSIRAEARRLDAARVDVEVEGDTDLVDMFEMACSLGPIDCLVRDTYRQGSRR